jgi:hypothetical protein
MDGEDEPGKFGVNNDRLKKNGKEKALERAVDAKGVDYTRLTDAIP